MAVQPKRKEGKKDEFKSVSILRLSYLITACQSLVYGDKGMDRLTSKLPFLSSISFLTLPATAGMNQWLTLFKCMQPYKNVVLFPTILFHLRSGCILHLSPPPPPISHQRTLHGF